MMKRTGKIVAATVLTLLCMAGAGVYYSGLSRITLFGFVLNTFLSRNNPLGTLIVERRRTGTSASGPAPALAAAADAALLSSDPGDWPSYNRTLTSERYAPLPQINTKNVDRLKEICQFDTHLRENYESGPIVVHGALIFTSALDTFSIDPSTCRLNWQAHENYQPLSPNLVNRGAAYLDGRLFRGTLDGRVIAYDFNTGKRLWVAVIGDPSKELVDAALIAWDGLVFAGVAQGDTKGVRGRMYALSASDGHVVWETYVVPPLPGNAQRGPQGSMPAFQKESWKNAPDVPISGGGTWTSYTLDVSTAELYIPVGNSSPDFVESLRPGENLFTNSVLVLDAHTGNYASHYRVIPRDWHDWDVSNTPALITTRAGRKLLALAPKDGFLYAYDRGTKQLIYRSPVTRIEHPDVPLNTHSETHFCPGAVGGAEWNGVAFDPHSNLLFTGEDEWCTAVKLKTEAQVKAIEEGAYWMGADTPNPMALMGTQDPHSKWAGWLYATDADTGEWTWRLKSNYPILSGVTPTAGGLVFFGDMGGNLYAADIASGKPLWKHKVAGAIGGGVVTYVVDGKQRVAVAAGMSSVVWPTEQHTAKIVIFALPDAGSP
jgi:alcohol dehydrogenase (cytochrome c)